MSGTTFSFTVSSVDSDDGNLGNNQQGSNLYRKSLVCCKARLTNRAIIFMFLFSAYVNARPKISSSEKRKIRSKSRNLPGISSPMKRFPIS